MSTAAPARPGDELGLRDMLLLCGVAFAFAMIMGGATMPSPLYPLYADRFQFGNLTITIIFAVYAIAVVGTLIVMRSWSEHFGRRSALIAGLVCAILGDLAFANAESLKLLLVGRLLSGIAAGIFVTTATVYVIELLPESQRSLGTLVATAANMGGLGIGPIFGGIVAELLPGPLLTPFLIHLGVCVLAIVAIWLAPETNSRTEPRDLSIRLPTVPPEAMHAFVPAAIAAFASFMVCGSLGAISPSFLTDVLSVEDSILIGATAGLIFLFSIPGELIMERLRSDLRFPVGCAILLVGVLVYGAGLFFKDMIVLLSGVLISGIGNGITFRAGIDKIEAAAPEGKKEQTVSMFFVVGYLALALPIVAAGFIETWFSLWTTSLLFAVVVAAMLIVAIGLIMRRRAVSG